MADRRSHHFQSCDTLCSAACGRNHRISSSSCSHSWCQRRRHNGGYRCREHHCFNTDQLPASPDLGDVRNKFPCFQRPDAGRGESESILRKLVVALNIVADKVKHRATYLAPVGIGLNLFVIHLFLLAWTGCSLNPARSLGPAAVGGSFPPHHCTFVLHNI